MHLHQLETIIYAGSWKCYQKPLLYPLTFTNKSMHELSHQVISQELEMDKVIPTPRQDLPDRQVLCRPSPRHTSPRSSSGAPPPSTRPPRAERPRSRTQTPGSRVPIKCLPMTFNFLQEEGAPSPNIVYCKSILMSKLKNSTWKAVIFSPQSSVKLGS